MFVSGYDHVWPHEDHQSMIIDIGHATDATPCDLDN